MTRKTSTVVLIPALVLTTGLAFGQANFQDVLPTGPDGSFYGIIQIAKALGLAVPSSMGTCLSSSAGGANPPIVPPPGPGGVPSQMECPYFGPDDNITRAEAAYWIVRSQADETQITNFLCATGGDPSGLAACAGVPGGTGVSTFGDLGVGGSSITNPFVQTNLPAGFQVVSNQMLMRDIEVAARRGYTKGEGGPCLVPGGTSDAQYRFCPNDPINRAEMAVFIIRAKMSNVFPTSLSGIPSTTPYGDNFSYPPTPYFTDVTPTDPAWGVYFPFVQEMRALGITNGTSPTTYSPGYEVTRKEIAAFAVRAFFL